MSGDPAKTRYPMADWLVPVVLYVSVAAAGAAWVLSALGMLNQWGLSAWWIVVIAGGVAWARRHAGDLEISKIPHLRLLCWDEWVLVGVVCAMLLASFLMGALAPPNNGDSMIYHLPRQIFWMSHGSVFGAEMPNPHMSKMPPLSEYLGLNLYLLFQTDRLHFLVQWTAYFGCLILVFRTIRMLGGNVRTALLGCVIFGSIPSVFLEASNTKNDVLVAFFFLGILSVILRVLEAGNLRWSDAVLAGACAGCAVLTKGTAIAFLPVVGGVSLVVLILTRVRLGWAPAAAGILVAIALPMPHYAAQFDEILKSERGESSSHANAALHPAAGMAVFFQNVGLQLATPLSRVNHSIESTVAAISNQLGFPVNDARTTFMGTEFVVRTSFTSEDAATALPLAMLSIAGILLIPFVAPRERRMRVSAIFLCALLMLYVFSFLFRWQPWHGRLLIPVFAFFAIGAAMVHGGFGRWWALSGTIVCVVWLWPSLGNHHRPLIGVHSLLKGADQDVVRNVNLPAGREAAAATRMVVDRLGPSRVGLDFSGTTVIYPVLKELQRADGSWPEFFPGSPPDPAVDVSISNRAETEDTRLQSSLPGWHSIPVGGGWNISLPPGVNVQSLGLSTPPFAWPGAVDGVGVIQGPYPEFQLPAFRNAFFPNVEMSAAGVDRARELVLELGTSGIANRAVLSVNEIVVAEIEILASGDRIEFRYPVPPGSGPLRISIGFESGAESGYDPKPVAARIFRMNLIDLEP